MTVTSPESRRQADDFAERAKELRQRLQAHQSYLEKLRVAFSEGQGSAREMAEAANERDRITMHLDAGRRTLLGQLAPGGHVAGGHGLDPANAMVAQYIDPDSRDVIRRVAESNSSFETVRIGEIPADVLALAVKTGSL